MIVGEKPLLKYRCEISNINVSCRFISPRLLTLKSSKVLYLFYAQQNVFNIMRNISIFFLRRNSILFLTYIHVHTHIHTYKKN